MNIESLPSDILHMFGNGACAASEELLVEYGSQTALAVHDKLKSGRGPREPNTLYMSEIGKPCGRQLWYGVNHPNLGEPLLGHTKFKFLYGDLIEETVLLLAAAAGHTVEHRQMKVHATYMHYGVKWRVSGRLDAVIDGVLVDVKSCSPYGYKKFGEGLTDSNDSFGYRGQLSGYNSCFPTPYEQQGFLAVDKQNGHVGWFEEPLGDTEAVVITALEAAASVVEPPRRFALVPDGKSGNMKLCVECSYCPFKQTCWRDSNHGVGLKAYAYSYGPVFLGVVKYPPRVPEIAWAV